MRDGTAAEAFAAVRTLAANPDVSIPFLKAKAAAEPKPDFAEIAKWMAVLDDKDFATRERADKALRLEGYAAKPPLRDALRGAVSGEFRQRAEAILDSGLDPGRTRAIRAVEVLTWIGGGAESKKLLAAWAAGAKTDPLAVEAGRSVN